MTSPQRHPRDVDLAPYAPIASLSARWSALTAKAGGRSFVAGHSVEGRPIDAFEIGASPANAPTILLTSLMHGVEMIAALALQRSVTAMLDQRHRALKRARLIVVPVVNPDAVAHNVERLADGRRAYRRCNANGVDLNRNFPRIGDVRTRHPFAGSRWTRSPHYMGTHALSEPESRAIAGLALATQPVLSLGFHSFGELLLYPYAHTSTPHPARAEYVDLGAAFVHAQPLRPYKLAPSMQLYPTRGDLDDWLDATIGTRAFTVEVSRPSAAILRRDRLSNPFCWMNPTDARDVEQAIANVVPGVGAMIDRAVDRGLFVLRVPREIRRDESTRFLDAAE